MSALLFCGDNRQRELQRLKRAYDDVAAAAQSRRAGRQLEAPVNRVVLIDAERGLGKTRLVMEFYRHLLETSDPEGYWPDTVEEMVLTNAVMPRCENCDYAASPAFLWWAMAIPDGANPGSTVFASLEDLFPHLTSAVLAERRRRIGRDVALEVGDLAVDLGIPAAELALEVTGLGTIKRTGSALWQVSQIVRRIRAGSGDALAEGQARADTVIDAVLTDLGKIMHPKSRLYAGLPLVVFIDDAQFVSRDPMVASLVERLIFLSSTNC